MNATKSKRNKVLRLCFALAVVVGSAGGAILLWTHTRAYVLGDYDQPIIRTTDAKQLSAQALAKAGVQPQDFSMQWNVRGGASDPLWVDHRGKYTLWHPTDVSKYGSISYAVYLQVRKGRVVAEVEESK